VAPLILFLPISHAFQPLDVACFQPFKTTFKRKSDGVMVGNNYIKSNKIIVRWANKSLGPNID
jgi:hypothetical protein